MSYFLLFKSDFYAFGSKKSSLREQDWALKDSLFLIHLKVQSLEALKAVIKKSKMSQKYHVLYEWPQMTSL